MKFKSKPKPCNVPLQCILEDGVKKCKKKKKL